MESIGAYEAKTHLPRLLDRVARGESLLITRHSRPVARSVPVEHDDRESAGQAARRLVERRRRLKRASLAELTRISHQRSSRGRRGAGVVGRTD